MKIHKIRGRLLATTIIASATMAAIAAGPATAQTAAPAAPAAPTPAGPQEIIVTGTMIKRINQETASPIQVINSAEMQRSGYNTITDVLSNLSGNGAGTLSASNSEAFAGGAAGVALRGLSVGATLVLVDGHRVAPYPLSDDGERQFTDIQSIPFGAVEQVQVLKDGASSIYGSDAIAGVVNVILKKQITGVDLLAEGGTTQHGGGTSKHFAIAMGKGDLGIDGFNAYVTAEYRNQDAINIRDRQYEPWGSLNFTGIGGNDFRPGAYNIFNAPYPSTLTPYLVNPNGSLTFLGSGCNATTLTAGKCAYTSPQVLQSPTQTISVLGGYTREFGDGWEAKLRVSYVDSKDQQSSITTFGLQTGFPQYPGASYSGNVSNPIGATPTPAIGYIPNYTLPANYLGSGSQAGAYLVGVLPGMGLPTINIDSQTFRLALDVTGKVLGWDTTESVGFSEVQTLETFSNYVNFDSLYTELTTFNSSGQPLFNPLGGNSAAVMGFIAPQFTNTATDRLIYAQFDATRKVVDLPGGDLSLAAGASVVDKDLNNPGPGPVLDGSIGGTFSTYAIGGQTDVAEYLEADANLFHSLEIDVSARDDWYNTYGNSLTPKVGVKWRPIDQVALRGTFSQGFRAPAPAEIGQSATVFGLGGFSDPVLCGNNVGQVPADCAEQVGFVQKTNPLRPETSTSFTGGVVVEPVRNWSTTFDYYHITIDHQIVSASELPTYSFTGSNCVRGPALATAGVVTGTNPDGTPILGTGVPLAGPIDACFAGYVNAQSTTTSGLDIESHYMLKLGQNTFRATAELTHVFSYNLTAPDGTTFKLVGTHGPSGVSGDTANPSDRADGSVSWDRGPLSVTFSGYWIAPYKVIDPSASGGAQATCGGAWNAAGALAGVTPSAINSKYCHVASFTNINLVTSYKLTAKLTATLTVDNLLDAYAPLDPETYGGSFTPYNPALHEDGVIGRYFQIGFRYKF